MVGQVTAIFPQPPLSVPRVLDRISSKHGCELQDFHCGREYELQSLKTSRQSQDASFKTSIARADTSFRASKLPGLKARTRASRLQDTDASFRVARLQAVCGTCLPQLSKNCDAFRGCDWNVFTTWNCLQQLLKAIFANRWVRPHVCT